MQYTNNHNISIPMAVWLLHDEYDYKNDPHYISATTLLRPLKQIILSRRIKSSDRVADLSDLIASRFGQAVHDGMEKAWKKGAAKNLPIIGIPEHIVERLVINPTEEQLKDPNILPVWIEKRAYKKLGKWTIGGMSDLIIDNKLFDNKTTSVYTYIFGSRDKDFAMQGGIYRWLQPEFITDPYIYIQYVFTDWQKSVAKRDPKYPQLRLLEKPILMPSIEDTEDFMRNKLNMLEKLFNAKEEDIPDCTDEELWRSAPQYKYYSDPNKTDGRATRNFDTLAEANQMLNEKGKGVVKTILGEVKACGYCPAYDACKQRERYDV